MFDRNLPFNDLPNLPPSALILDAEILIKWGLASRNLAELNKNLLRMPNPSMLINTIGLREAKTSTAIENIFTTDDELYRAISSQLREEHASPSTKEVLRYREALWGGYQLIKRENRVTEDVILTVFQKMKNTTQRFRPPQSLTVIRRGNSELRPGEVIYTPPRGEQIIHDKIQNLLEFLNLHPEIDPLLKMAIAHYQFEAIHPFTDGNGRTGRILNLLYLVDQGLLSQPVLYLSRYILDNKTDYYHLLAGVTQRAAWKPWLLFMMEAVEQTAKQTNQMIDAIMDQKEATLQTAKRNISWYSSEFNDLLFSQPYIKQDRIKDAFNIKSRTTLVKYANELKHQGIVSSIYDKKEVYYINNDLVRILAET